MNVRGSFHVLALCALTGGAALAEPAKLVAPDTLIRDAADRVFVAIDSRRAEFEANPAGLQAVAEEHLLPHFDVDYAARLVLGRYWNLATPEQQQRFQKAFTQFLMRTYAKGMLDFRKDAVKVLPLAGATDPKRTIVRSEVKRLQGQRVPVDYTLRMTPSGWKVYDVTIEGISYVRNYRTSFGEEIERSGGGDPKKGIEAMVSRLESGKGPAAPAAEGAK